MAYTDRWTLISDLVIESGNQGESHIVEEIISQKKGFLKILKDGEIAEKRQRFVTEINTLERLEMGKISGVPKLYDHNAKYYLKKEIEMYYVSEYIEGLRLDKYLSQIRPTEETIIKLFSDLLKILIELNKYEIVHRDIKPENIVIANNGKLYLVDFGITFSGIVEKSCTKIGQELGNRFLRLPELSAGGINKHDSRSDLTFACGIALYLLTNKYPRQLQTEIGEYPHQIESAQMKLSKLKYKSLWNRIFDRAFCQKISDRWSFASEIMEITDKMKETKEEIKISYEDTLNLITLSQTRKYETFNKVYNELIHVQKLLTENIIQLSSKKYKEILRHEVQGTVLQLGDIETNSIIRIFPIPH